MGSLLISTLGTLSPKAYYLFIIIVAVGFFGVYVPWNEKKKRAGSQPSASQPKKPERKPAPPISRPQALLAFFLCLPLAAVGLILLIAGAVMGETLLLLIGIALSVGALAGAGRAGQVLFGAAPRQKPAPPSRPAPPDPKERDRLDQLDSLLDAGILTPEEYRERRSRILEGKR